MASYVVGDVQACLDGLKALLAKVAFRPGHDRLLLCGDLIGRGPEAAETLRFVRGLGHSALTVLGNHDLHLLALTERGEQPKPADRLDALLAAPDAEVLLGWLRRQRLAYFDRRHRTLLVHAGVAPQWTRAQTLALAKEVEDCLRHPHRGPILLREMYGDEPRRWSDELRGTTRLRTIINILTRARVCTADGEFDYHFKRSPAELPDGLLPWFAVPGRRTQRSSIVFGHWSTLGQVHWPASRVHGLDTGYLWGGRLTALRLDDRRIFDVSAPLANARVVANRSAGNS